jgi:hypothetical protein
MTQHTPGPWEFLPPDDGNCGAITAKTGWICDFAEEPSDANARLIAAAPDLLEALKNLVNQHNTVYGIGDMEMQSAIDFAHKAIAKATGEKNGN